MVGAERTQTINTETEIASLRTELAEVRNREAQFRLVAKLSRVVAFTLDRNLRYDWMHNPQVLEAAESFIGQPAGFWYVDEDAERLRAFYAAVLDSGEERQTSVTLRCRSTGIPHTFDLIAGPQVDDRGRISGLVCAAVNLTQERLREEDLREAKLAADRAVAAKNRFLAAASHDLRQPIQAIRLLQYAVADRVAGVDDPTLHKLAANLGTAVQAAEELLDRLMDQTVLEAGSLEPNVTTFAAADLLDAKRADFGRLAETKGLAFRVFHCSHRVRSDPVLLKRILRNYVVNAIKFTGRGGVLIGGRRRGDRLRIEVWDTGPGIPTDQQGVIFEAFAQVGECAATRSQGVGLGLAIAADTAKLLGHEIGVTSKLGKGSCFWVLVPLAE